MTIAYIGAGAAGTICANCLKDNALAAALRRQGEDVVLLPAYTPLLTDERDESESRVVFGGINLYLQSKCALFRRSGFLDWLVDHPRVLRWASALGVDTDPANLGRMTRDTFLGISGPLARELDKVVRVLQDIDPAVVHLTNSMLACMAGPVKERLDVPVVCSLSGEAEFLAGLAEPYRSECYDLLRGDARHIDWFVASCDDQARSMSRVLPGIANRTETILPGISLEGYGEHPQEPGAGFVVGFLARISEAKGLETLAAGVEMLRRRRPRGGVQLRVAGWRSAASQKYLDGLRGRYGFDDFGYVSRQGKIDFLRGLDAFSVPTSYPAAKGLYALEALASGVPVVLPRIGVCPELVAATGGGLLCAVDDSEDLAAKLEALLDDPDKRARLGAAGRAAVSDRFHADRMAAETRKVYRRVTADAGPFRRSRSDR